MTCIFRSIFHFPCPTCGVTRALFSLFTGNFQDYCYYNVMAIPLVFATGSMFFGIIKHNKKWIYVGFPILLVNIPYYIFRLVHGLIP
ncbi:MAG: DUF2752 domain-containing protein [Treponema sp.]|nr:DUF2752 domain-containing protein [Treponema sp.]